MSIDEFAAKSDGFLLCTAECDPEHIGYASAFIHINANNLPSPLQPFCFSVFNCENIYISNIKKSIPFKCKIKNQSICLPFKKDDKIN